MTLRCSSCGALLELDATFPAAIVRCRFCGGSTLVSRPAQRVETNPYRTPGQVPESPKARAMGSSSLGGAPCPRCGTPLAHAAPFGVEAYECSRCGVFASHDSLAALLAQTRRDSSPPTPPTAAAHDESQTLPPHESSTVYLRCPQCKGFMNRSRFSLELPFVIDVCKHHGIWFDRGEMQHALAFAARGGHYDPSKHRGPRPREPMALATANAPPTVGVAPDSPVLEVIDGVELLGDVLCAVVCWWTD